MSGGSSDEATDSEMDDDLENLICCVNCGAYDHYIWDCNQHKHDTWHKQNRKEAARRKDFSKPKPDANRRPESGPRPVKKDTPRQNVTKCSPQQIIEDDDEEDVNEATSVDVPPQMDLPEPGVLEASVSEVDPPQADLP